MGDEHTLMPGQGICAHMRYTGAEGGTREEICTFPPHNDKINHFYQDFQNYYDLIMGQYNEFMLDSENYTEEMRRAREDFLLKVGEALQNLRRRQPRTPSEPYMEPPVPLGAPEPPSSGKYPPLRAVKDGEAAKELGICGFTSQRDGESYICVGDRNHWGQGKGHTWLEYHDATDDADRRWSRISWWAKKWWKNKLDQIARGSYPEDLPPPSSNTDPGDPDRWRNDETPSDPVSPAYPRRPETLEQERRKPFDPEQGGGHVGTRGPGTPTWDRARREGANWEEPDDGAARSADPSGGPLPPGVTGESLGDPFKRQHDRSDPTKCGLLRKENGALYICEEPFGHMSKSLRHRFKYIRHLDDSEK